MCEFCVQHGDGQKWYLAMKNYSRELMDQDGRVEYMIEFANGFEERAPRNLAPAEAIESVRKLDDQGLAHSVWTFKTPYIGALCNYDQDCIAYRICHSRGYFQIMFRAEFVAHVAPDACNGCKNCMRQCQFGAIRYSAANDKVEIDPRECFGCGVCRAACHKDAIALRARANDPVAARVW